MPTVTIEYEDGVINKVYEPYIDCDISTQIFYGGSSSGKSYFLAQRCVIDVLNGDHNYLVTRKVARTLRGSSFNEIKKSISFFNADKLFSINQADMVITCANGYQILFAGLDDVEKIKSITPAKGVITDIWCEETTEDEYDDIKQLEKRLRGRSTVKKRMIFSFNPIFQTHWIYNMYFAGKWDESKTLYKDKDLLILKTTYRDNEFLTDDDIYKLENETDKYYKSVYSDGNWGVIGKVIFRNWRTENLSDKKFPHYNNGLDFGFANDPTALVRLHYDRKRSTLYILDAQYLYGYTNDLIAAEIKSMCGDETIICDCSEPKSIQELRQLGAYAIPTEKGKDSVNFGIQWLQKLNIIIDCSLVDAINEFTTYKWIEDKDGNVLPKPIDKNNHIIDAIRYALSIEMRQNGNLVIGDNIVKKGGMYFAKGNYNPIRRR